MDKELLETLGKILDEKLDPIKNEIQKNSLLLEDLNKKVSLLRSADCF